MQEVLCIWRMKLFGWIDGVWPWVADVRFCAGHNTLTSLGFQSRHARKRGIWSQHHFFFVGKTSIVLSVQSPAMRVSPSLKLVPIFCLLWKPSWFFSLTSSPMGVQRTSRHWSIPLTQRRNHISSEPFVLNLPEVEASLQSCSVCLGLIQAEWAVPWVLLGGVVYTRDRGQWNQMSLKSYHQGTCSMFSTSFQQAGL